jgi:hypothetical protein
LRDPEMSRPTLWAAWALTGRTLEEWRVVANVADPVWATQQLDHFIELTDLVDKPSVRGGTR